MISRRRYGLGIILLIPVAFASMGTRGCSFGGLFPVLRPDFVDIELSNEAFDPVAPGLYVDGAIYLDLENQPLAAGERGVLVQFDCRPGMTLQTNALLLTAEVAIPSDNRPLLREGLDFRCGDLISFTFIEVSENNVILDFFTRVERNGRFLADKPIR